MTIPIPGSRYEPDDEGLEALRREVIRLRRERLALSRALHALQRYDGDGQPRERGIWVRQDDVIGALRTEP